MSENNKQIINLYDHFKNTPKKLKIICDWDEVIQAHEPYAFWLAKRELNFEGSDINFVEYFKYFWIGKKRVEYSPYGSKLTKIRTVGYEYGKWREKEAKISEIVPTNLLEKQQAIKNSPTFYQQAPFLTLAEDLLKLIKEKKAQVIFLSAYDKRKFPNGDERKKQIFAETFDKLNSNNLPINFAEMRLIPFDSEILERVDFSQTLDNKTKADWIRENVPDADIVIDDNPNICKEILDTTQLCKGCHEIMVGNNAPSELPECKTGKCIKIKATILAPHYPATANQHHSEVLLVKNEVSDLKKEEFVRYV